MSATTLKAGDRLTVTGGAAYKQANAMYVRRMQRGDGFLYEQVGFTMMTGIPCWIDVEKLASP